MHRKPLIERFWKFSGESTGQESSDRHDRRDQYGGACPPGQKLDDGFCLLMGEGPFRLRRSGGTQRRRNKIMSGRPSFVEIGFIVLRFG